MPDPVTPDTAAGPANGSPPAAEPWLARAHRVLSGDVRPDDYLPVTPEVTRAVAVDLAFVRTGRGEVAPEVEGRQLRQALVCFHHGGQDIAALEDDRGVVVLAVGHPQIRELLRGRPHKDRSRIMVQTPDVW